MVLKIRVHIGAKNNTGTALSYRHICWLKPGNLSLYVCLGCGLAHNPSLLVYCGNIVK